MTRQEYAFCRLYSQRDPLKKSDVWDAYRAAFDLSDLSNKSAGTRAKVLLGRADINAELARREAVLEREVRRLDAAESELDLDIELAKKQAHKRFWLNRLLVQDKIAETLEKDGTRLTSAENNFLGDSAKIHKEMDNDAVVVNTGVSADAAQALAAKLRGLTDPLRPENAPPATGDEEVGRA